MRMRMRIPLRRAVVLCSWIWVFAACADGDSSEAKGAYLEPTASPPQKPAPPNLEAELEKRGKVKIERGFARIECDQNKYKIHDMGDYGKFFIEANTQDGIKQRLLKGEEWEPHLQPLFERYIKPGDTVIDVGAHIGTHTIKFSKLVGPKGHVIAFEPQTKMFDELRCNLQLNKTINVTPLAVALGDTFGEVEMETANPLNEGGTGIGKGGNKAPLVPLDSYLLEKVSMLKIDVEGFEDFVVDGARRTIAKHKPIIFIEIQGGHNWDTAPPSIRQKITNTAGKLTSMGYHVDRVGLFDYVAQFESAFPLPSEVRSDQ